MPTILQFRRGTTAQNNNYAGSAGELTIDADLDVIRVHDGSTSGGHALVGVASSQTLTNKTLTSPTLNSGIVGTALTLNAQAELRYADSDSSNYVGFKAPGTIAANVSWTLPSADAGVSGYALVSDSAGTLSWAPAGATISQDESTNSGLQLYFASTTSGALTAVNYDSGLTYNPSSGTLTTAAVSATNLTGTLQTASQTNITGVGTLTSGTWTATTIGVAYGGTGVTSSTGTGSVVLNNSPSLVTPALGTPSSGTLTNATGLPIVAGTTGTLSVARGGTGVTSSTGSGSVVLSASPTFTGTIVAATINAATIGNSGAAITGSTLTGTLQTAAQTNVTSLGTLTGLTLSGTLTGTTINAATIGNSGAAITGSTLTGTIQTASQTNITGLGTITTGTWSATTIATNKGGTGLTSFTSGGALYATSTSALTTGTLPVASGGTGTTTSTGTGSVVLSSSPSLTTPALGTPSSGTLSSCSGLPIDGGTTGTLPVARGGTGVTSSTGTGSVVLSTSPSLTTPALGTPSSGTLSSCSGLPIDGGTTGTLPVARGGTGVTSSTGSGSVVLSTSPTFSTKIITPVIEKSGTDGVGDIGQSGNKYATIYATTFSGTASTANYADLAEKYVADGDYEPGTVMVFGGEKEVTASLLSYETAIAGVISTAPAYLMNNELNEENTVSIALVGRVPCKVMGPVSKGTVLVTSEHAGVAMAIDNSKFLPGSIIGRAMEEHLESGVIKTIEVSVGRS